MSEIGSLGGVTFEVSFVKNRAKMLSFSDLTRTLSTEFAEHKRNGKKPLLEFSGPDLNELTMSIIAKAEFQINPIKVSEKLTKYAKDGERLPFLLGGKKVGSGYYAITNISQPYKEILANGKIAQMNFDVTLKEYPKVTTKAKTTKTKKGKNAKAKKKTTKQSKASGYTIYEVKKGDTLTGLAVKFYKRASLYTKIYNANKKILKSPDKIYVHQKLKIPK